MTGAWPGPGGTTGRSKGVVTTHANVTAQIVSLVSAWGWTGADRTVLALPLHHVHGLINVLGSAFWSGAVGYFAYDVVRTIERLPSPPPRGVDAPDAPPPGQL